TSAPPGRWLQLHVAISAVPRGSRHVYEDVQVQFLRSRRDEPVLCPLQAASKAPCRLPADDRLTLTYRRESLRLGPPARGDRRFGFSAAQTSQPARTLPLDQRLQCFANQSRFFLEAGEGLSFGQKVIVKGYSRTHRPLFALQRHENSII